MSEETESQSLTWRWLAGLLITVVFSIGAWSSRGIAQDVESLKSQLNEQKAAVSLRVQTLETQLSGVREAQEREHRLLVKIAKRMGIEVAE